MLLFVHRNRRFLRDGGAQDGHLDSHPAPELCLTEQSEQISSHVSVGSGVRVGGAEREREISYWCFFVIKHRSSRVHCFDLEDRRWARKQIKPGLKAVRVHVSLQQLWLADNSSPQLMKHS